MSGSRNRTTQSLDQELQQSLRNLQSEFLQFKNRQPVGADVLNVSPVPPSGYLNGGPLTLAAGASGSFTVTITPANQTLTLWNYLFSVAVDVNDATNNVFPGGPSLTAAQRNMRLYHWIDWALSSDTTNVRVIKMRIENSDVSSHDYYVFFRSYLPTLPGSTGG